ncbi:MAG: VOC family protein [Candidatus Eremiobacteraeota bacterium]|nr:VOC family protein [Candidatus Eremiobacteraeota bacterium]
MTTGTATEKTLELQPYIFFYGKCAEALAFYKEALGGSYEMQTIGESPMASQFPPETHHRIMHGSFSGSGISFLASDGRETKDVDPDEGNICLAIRATDAATGERIFAALSEGGTVSMPIADVPWGGRFGMFVDRYGIEWMMTLP